MDNISEIKNQCRTAAAELISAAKLKKGDVLVVGCSTSEVGGAKIGTESTPETAKAIFEGINSACTEKGIYLAVQCCEHLNRAIVTEAETVKNAEPVNAVPQNKAGGALATVAYSSFKHPVVLEEIKADAGMDIGDTLIGMHLKKVAVPVRLSLNKIGKANLVCARVRPKFIGGVRAVYDQNML